MSRRRLRWLLLLGIGIGCSDLTTTDDGVVALILFLPKPPEVEVSQTIPLRGAALNADGDTLNVPIYWRALDTTIVVDSTGFLTGRTEGAEGYVIARAGGLYSDSARFIVIPRGDTLIRIAAEEDSVAAGEDSSAALTVRLEGGDPPAPVAGRRIIYEVVDPVFTSFDARTVDLTGDSLVALPLTSSTGEPAPIHLRRRPGFTAPDSAIVTVSAYRPGGEAIPGSGQRFVVRFEQP